MQSYRIAKKLITALTGTMINCVADSPGLMAGCGGQLLFAANMQLPPSVLSRCMDNYLESCATYDSAAFADGLAGNNWLAAHLSHVGILAEADCASLQAPRQIILSSLQEKLALGNYDFFYGASGMLYSCPEDQEVEAYFSALLRIKQEHPNGVIPGYDLINHRIIADQVNLGLSHGLPSLLLLASVIDNQAPSMRRFANDVMDFFIEFHNELRPGANHLSVFPSFYSFEKRDFNSSRLAWCYGDLGIAYALTIAGMRYDRPDAIACAEQSVWHSLNRQSAEDTLISEFGFCHGSAGVSHLFSKFWRLYGDPRYKVASDFWAERTLAYLEQLDPVSWTKPIDAGEQQNANNYCSLIEGVPGALMTLQSWLTGDSRWDACLMLQQDASH